MGKVFAKNAQKKGSKVCAFFKAGLCQKGKKCKFSHILENHIQAKKKTLKIENEKIDMFTDQRDLIFGKKDVIENWNSKKLAEVINYNDMKYVNPTTTNKTCKHFL